MGVPAKYSGAWDNCPAFGATLMLGRPILTALSFLFTLLSLATVRPTLVTKASMRNPCEEIRILRGVQDTRALVGKVFFYPISPFAFQGKVTHYKVTLSNGSALPKWLTYNPSTSTLQGLAMPEEKGEYCLTVVAYGEACGPHTPSTGVNFAIHVQDDVFVHQKEMGQDQNNVQTIICSSRLCARNVSVTFAELIIHHTSSLLEIQERLYLVCTMAEYLHLDPALLTLTPFEDSFHRYLQNLTMLAEDIRHVKTVKGHFVSLYWPVGFGVFAMFYELLQVLRHVMESNHLSQLLGYEIAGWRILKREGHEKHYSGKRLRRQLMATPRLTPRPVQTEGFMVLSTSWLHNKTVVRPHSSLFFEVTKKAIPIYSNDLQSVTSEGNLEALDIQTLLNVQTKTPTASILQDFSTAVPELFPSLIFTSSHDFLHSVTSEGDLEVLDMQIQLNIQTKTPSSSVFPEILPSLMTSTELEGKVTSKTPPTSQQLQSQVPQSMEYSLPKKSESEHHFVLYHFGSSVPTSTTPFSWPSRLTMDSYSSSEETPVKTSPVAHFGEKILDYGGPYVALTTSGLILQDIISTAKASVLPVTTLVNQKASPEFLLSRADMSLRLSDSSYWSQELTSNYKHAPEAYVSVLWIDSPLFTEERSSPFTTIQTGWERDFSFMGITSTSGSATASRASAHMLGVPPDTSPTVPLYDSDSLPTLPMHSTQEFNTPLLVHSLEFGLVSRTSSTPAKFLSLPLSLSTDLILSNILPVEELFPDWGQGSLEVSHIYENSEYLTAVPETYGYLFTKDHSAPTASHIDTTLSKEQSHFICVTSSSVPVLSSKLPSGNGLFRGTSWISTRSSYDALVFSWPTEFAGSLKSSLFTSEYGWDYSGVVRTSVAHPDLLHLNTSDLNLKSSFGTKANFQITKDLISELMKESIIPSNKETSSQLEFYATSLYHGVQGQRNTSPRIVNAIKWLTATIGHKFSFSIPPDTFYDQEDGNTTQLSLGMNPADYSPTGQESWLQFNSCYQVMSGYPLDHDFQYSPQEFLLFATDSGGLRTSDTLTIELLRPTVTPCHLYTIRTKNSYHSFLRNRGRIGLFFEKLSSYLSAGDPGNLTLFHLRPGSTVISWYNNSICTRSIEQCATDEIQRVLIKLGVPGGNVNPDFVEAMLPEYKIDQIEDITYNGICLDITKPFTECLPSNRTLSTFKDSQSWIRNILFALLISVSTTVMLVLIIIFHCCKYHKKASGLQSASSHARPFFSYIDFEMDVLKSRKPPMLDQEVLQAAQPWLHLPPLSQQHPCRPKRTLSASRLPPPPKYRLPPSYGMEESGQSCHDHDQRRSNPKARLY